METIRLLPSIKHRIEQNHRYARLGLYLRARPIQFVFQDNPSIILTTVHYPNELSAYRLRQLTEGHGSVCAAPSLTAQLARHADELARHADKGA